MRLIPGHRYQTRDGKRRVIVEEYEDEILPAYCFRPKGVRRTHTDCWTALGDYFANGMKNGNDLVLDVTGTKAAVCATPKPSKVTFYAAETFCFRRAYGLTRKTARAALKAEYEERNKLMKFQLTFATWCRTHGLTIKKVTITK